MSLKRLAPLSGLAFVVSLIAFRIIEGGSLPDPDDSTASVVAFWVDHRDEQIAVAIIASFATFFFTIFAAGLFGVLRQGEEGDGYLAPLTLAGAVLTATGMLAVTTVEFAAADSAGKVPADVTQALSVLQADTWFGIAVGFAVFGIGAGLAVLKLGLFPRWMGWLSLVTGVLWLTPIQFIAIFLSVIFVAGTSVVQLRGGPEPAAT